MKVLIVIACYLASFVACQSHSRWVNPATDRRQFNQTCTTDDNQTGKWDYVSNCDVVTFFENTKRNFTVNHLAHHKDNLVICCVSRTELVTISRLNSFQSRINFEASQAPPYCLNVDDHIVDGDKAKVGEYKHMAALGYYNVEKKDYEFNCGGTLISDRFVMTAAHCTSKRIDTPVIVRLGRTSLDLSDSNDTGKVLDVFIKKVFLPKEYDALLKTNDIALLELETKIVFDAERCKNIRPAKLWEDDLSDNENKNMTVIGFGRTETNGPRSDWLLEATIKEMPLKECREKLGLQATLTDSHLCCHDPTGRKDACQGDSGSSLQIRDHDGYKIVGVVSYGAGCGSKYPSIYTRVSAFIPWINSIVWQNERSTK